MTAKSPHLPWAHLLLAIAIMAVWGSNFVVIKIALSHLPPLLFATLRFALVLIPAVFFLKRPAVPWWHLAAYGVLIGAGQFGLLYIAMEHSISPGLASLVIQTQVFFTIGLAMWFTGERVSLIQWFALGLAGAGLGLIVANRGGDVTPLGLVLVLFAALGWAGGNLVAKAGGTVNMLSYVVWSSLFAVPPLLLFSILLEGMPAIETGLQHADALTWAAVLYQSVGNTMFGYACWGWLMARHPAATVAPFALLVPVFGMSTSALLLGEPLQSWKLIAAGLVLAGLALNLAWPRVQAALARA
ncbi:MAG TPA: EamA family transporter [Rhizomicrobium sp.]|jgi:O-acetylserine/cysteine efflux transporter|nr:EamA family transporter [Rhizomicrobium sp.]